MSDYETPKQCEKCSSKKLKTRRCDYLVPKAKKLIGRELAVGRVWVKECEECKHQQPTEAGMDKVIRCLDAAYMRFRFDGLEAQRGKI